MPFPCLQGRLTLALSQATEPVMHRSEPLGDPVGRGRVDDFCGCSMPGQSWSYVGHVPEHTLISHTHTHPLSRPQINISPCRLFVGSQISLLDIYQSLLIAGRNSDLAQLKYQQLFLGLQSSYPIPKITVKKRRILPCP